MALSELRSAHAPKPLEALPRIEGLTLDDVDDGLALSDAAGWNQTADDWSLFIERGRAFGCRDGAGQLVATAATLPYGSAVGWISMVLVAEDWRHRGLASAMLRECVAHLQASATLPWLDATPAGAAVYRRLGFAAGFEFERWQSNGSRCAAIADHSLRRADARDLDRIAALDLSATQLDRRFLLESFLSRAGTQSWLSGDGDGQGQGQGPGFIIARAGRRATQIGPLVAANGEQAIALLDAALGASMPTTFIDVPTARREPAVWLQSRGFERQRSFVRMSLGAAQVPVVSESSFALAGPEFG